MTKFYKKNSHRFFYAVYIGILKSIFKFCGKIYSINALIAFRKFRAEIYCEVAKITLLKISKDNNGVAIRTSLTSETHICLSL